jgi:hypothetical protein
MSMVIMVNVQGVISYSPLIGDPHNTTLWKQGWKIGRTVGLEADEVLLWNRYIQALRKENIRLTERDDEIIWDEDPGGFYTPKVGYVQLSIDPLQQDEKWWWRKIWKQKLPAKGKFLVWTILENKIPMWDILQKRQFHGSSWCSLCKNQGETTDHIFMHFSFTSTVWAEATKLNNAIFPWQGASFEEALKDWLSSRTPQNLKAFPLIVMPGGYG